MIILYDIAHSYFSVKTVKVKKLVRIIIYQSSKFSFSPFLLVENVSHEIDEIRLSPSHSARGRQ